jgi:SAM-dependent methyltransferase
MLSSGCTSKEAAVGEDVAGHWTEIYRSTDEASVSWFQPVPTQSLAILDELGVDPTCSVVDVGAGASRLVDELVARGFTDVTVLDVSATGLDQARTRLGDRAAGVEWVVHDLLSWAPSRTFDVWHDRAVFHFLTTAHEVQSYLGVLGDALGPRGLIGLGTFAADGPTHCSGLPVSRYTPDELGAVFGPGFDRLGAWREVHRTPTGAVQAFTWVALRRH